MWEVLEIIMVSKNEYNLYSNEVYKLVGKTNLFN